MTNIEQLKKRKRALMGASVSVPFKPQRDQMAIELKLTLQGKAINPRNILVARMQSALDLVPEPHKPFAEAVLELYEAQEPKQ